MTILNLSKQTEPTPIRVVGQIPKAPERGEVPRKPMISELRATAAGADIVASCVQAIPLAKLADAVPNAFTSADKKLIATLSARVDELQKTIVANAPANRAKRLRELTAANGRALVAGKPTVDISAELARANDTFSAAKAGLTILAEDVKISLQPLLCRLADAVEARLETMIAAGVEASQLVGADYTPQPPECSLARLCRHLRRASVGGIGNGTPPKDFFAQLGAEI